MNLMPDSTLRWQSFNQKKPFLIATVVSMVLVTFAVGFLFHKLADNKKVEIDRLDPQVSELSSKMDRFKQAYSKTQKTQAEATQIATYMQDRYYWGDLLMELRYALIRSEDNVKKKLSSEKPGVEAGVWIEQIGQPTTSPDAAAPVAPVYNDPYLRGKQQPTPPPEQPAAAQPAGPNTNSIILICRAVSLTSVDSSANPSIAYAVENEIKNLPMVDAQNTQLSPNISPDEPNGTFTFTVNLVPKNPLNF